jgi:predicted transcriptional regulator YheO
MKISGYIPICNAIVSLLKPLVEIVIHDLQTDKIIFIAGDLSKRNIGDPSLLDIDMHDIEKKIEQIIYPKLNFDGRLVKSISVPLKENEQIKALLCINCDVSVFSQMQSLSQIMLPNLEVEKPNMLFKNDWQERLHLAVHNSLKEKNWSFESLVPRQKKILVHELFIAGAFAEKNAADYIAKILDMGRATLFKYLKEWRN